MARFQYKNLTKDQINLLIDQYNIGLNYDEIGQQIRSK